MDRFPGGASFGNHRCTVAGNDDMICQRQQPEKRVWAVGSARPEIGVWQSRLQQPGVFNARPPRGSDVKRSAIVAQGSKLVRKVPGNRFVKSKGPAPATDQYGDPWLRLGLEEGTPFHRGSVQFFRGDPMDGGFGGNDIRSGQSVMT